MVIQGAYLYLGLIWHGLAGELLSPGAIEAHGRQFLALRRIQAAAWIVTILLSLTWLRRARGGGPWWVSCPWWVGWWWALVLAAGLTHALAAGLAVDRSRPLDLGAPLQLLLLAEILEIAAAVLAILLVRWITDRRGDRGRALP